MPGTGAGDDEFFAYPVAGEDVPSNAWVKRHGRDFPGKRLPFGCGAFFKPAVTKYHLDKANTRGVFGIFLGYRLAPGGRWNGEYRVADLSDFTELDLS